MSDPKVGRHGRAAQAVVGALDVGDLGVGEGAAADGGEHDALGERGEEALEVVAGSDGFGEETHLDGLAALEGEFGGGEAGADLCVACRQHVVAR